MLRVDFTETWGEIYVPAVEGDYDCKCTLHPANCLGAVIYRYESDGEKLSQLILFFADKQHVESIAKSGHGFGFSKARLNAYYLNKEGCSIVAMLTKYLAKEGTPVEYYYEEPKLK